MHAFWVVTHSTERDDAGRGDVGIPDADLVKRLPAHRIGGGDNLEEVTITGRLPLTPPRRKKPLAADR